MLPEKWISWVSCRLLACCPHPVFSPREKTLRLRGRCGEQLFKHHQRESSSCILQFKMDRLSRRTRSDASTTAAPHAVLLNKWADEDDEVPAMKCCNLWCKMWSDSKAQLLLLASNQPPLASLPPFSQKSISPLCFQGNRRHVWRDEAVKQQEAEEESQDSWGTFKQINIQK